MNTPAEWQAPEYLSLQAELKKKTGEGLKIARLQKRLSLAQAAEKSGIDAFTIRALEKGEIRQELCMIHQLYTKYEADYFSAESLMNEILLNKSIREWRNHDRAQFSIIGPVAKPWEKLPSGLNEIRLQNYRDLAKRQP